MEAESERQRLSSTDAGVREDKDSGIPVRIRVFIALASLCALLAILAAVLTALNHSMNTSGESPREEAEIKDTTNITTEETRQKQSSVASRTEDTSKLTDGMARSTATRRYATRSSATRSSATRSSATRSSATRSSATRSSATRSSATRSSATRSSATRSSATRSSATRSTAMRPSTKKRTKTTRRTTSTTRKSRSLTCNTADCSILRRLFADARPSNGDPCKNFYTYVCDKLSKKQEQWFVPEDRSSYTVMDMPGQRVLQDIIKHLSSTPVPKSGQTAVQKAAALYQGCMKAQRNAETQEALHSFLRMYGLVLTEELSFDPLDVFVDFGVRTGIPLMLSLGVTFAPGVSDAIFTFHRPPEYVEWGNVRSYLVERHILEKFVSSLLTVTGFQKPGERVNDLAQSIIKADTAVRELDELHSEEEISVLLPLSSVGTLLNKTHFHNMLLRHSMGRLPGNRTLAILKRDLEFLLDLFGQNSKIIRADLQRYIAWTTLSYLSYSASMLGRPNSHKCFKITERFFTSAAVFPTLVKAVNETRVDDVRKMTELVAAEVYTSLGASDWMDDATRTAAQQKLSSVTKLYAFWPELNTTASLDEHFKTYPDIEGPFIKDFLAVIDRDTTRLLGLALTGWLRKVVPRVSDARIHVPDAAYDWLGNSIFVTATGMLTPLFTYGAPPEVNYGALGRVVTHELMRTFDDYGRRLNGSGHRVNWWTPQSEAAYLQRRQCVNETISTATKSRTLAEYPDAYIPDIVAEEPVFKAYKKASATSNVTLGDAGGWTRDQLFYVSWCLLLCGDKTLHDDWLPAERCNVPLMNSEHFGEVFGCPLDSAMNPRRKCKFW